MPRGGRADPHGAAIANLLVVTVSRVSASRLTRWRRTLAPNRNADVRRSGSRHRRAALPLSSPRSHAPAGDRARQGRAAGLRRAIDAKAGVLGRAIGVVVDGHPVADRRVAERPLIEESVHVVFGHNAPDARKGSYAWGDTRRRRSPTARAGPARYGRSNTPRPNRRPRRAARRGGPRPSSVLRSRSAPEGHAGSGRGAGTKRASPEFWECEVLCTDDEASIICPKPNHRNRRSAEKLRDCEYRHFCDRPKN